MTPKQPVWVPSDIDSTNIVKFLKHVNKKHSLKLKTYDDLWRWSVHPDSLAEFWGEVCAFLRILPDSMREGDLSLARDSSGSSEVVFLTQAYDGVAFIIPGIDGDIATSIPPTQILPFSHLQPCPIHPR
jgi:hypothetical protein